MEVKFDFSELEHFNDELKKKMQDEWMEAALIGYGLKLERMVVDEIDRRKLQLSGDMKKSITHEVKQKLSEWLLRVGTDKKTESGYPYPVGVHEGTKPHWMPVAPANEYVRLKWGISEPKAMKRASWFLRKKIAEVGTRAHPFMQAVFDREKDKFAIQIGKELTRVMRGSKIV